MWMSFTRTNPYDLIKLLASPYLTKFLCLIQHNCCEDKTICIKSHKNAQYKLAITGITILPAAFLKNIFQYPSDSEFWGILLLDLVQTNKR